MDLSCLLAFVVLIFVHGVYCDSECDCNTNKELMELIHKDYLQMRLENFKIMSRLRRLEIAKQTVSTQSDPLTAKGSSQKVADGIDAKYAKITAQLERVNDIDAKYANITSQLERVDEIDAKYAKLNAQPERINKLEANIAHLTEQSEKKTRNIEDKLAKTVENLERIDEIEDTILKIEDQLEMMNRNEASSTNITAQMERMDKFDAKLTTVTSQIIGIVAKMDVYKMAFDFRNIISKTISAEKTSRNKFDSDIRNQTENIKHLFTEFKTETDTLVHNQSVSLSTKHETFTEQMTRQVAEVHHQMHTDIGDITSELNKVTEEVSKLNTEISTLNEITIEDKTDGAWGSWSSWGSCSATCGGGIRSQTRNCTNPKPSLLGKYCDGTPMKVSVCNKQTCPDIKVAFIAYGSGSETSETTIKFPNTRLNIGGAYSTSTGRFTCKIPGIYHFAVTLTKLRKDIDIISAYVGINGNPKLQLLSDPYDDSDGHFDYGSYSLSAAGTFHLNVNDYVYVYGVPRYFYNTYVSFFTGVLVIPDFFIEIHVYMIYKSEYLKAAQYDNKTKIDRNISLYQYIAVY